MTDTEARLADLTAQHKRDLLERLLERRAGEAERSFPLSFGQRALWYLYRLAPASAAYNIVCAVRIRSRVDIPALRRALTSVINRHGALRTVYTTENGCPVQRIQMCQDIPLEVTTCPFSSQQEIERRIFEEADGPFDLQRGPLLRIRLFLRSVDEAVLQLTVHHIAVDRWSLELLIAELSELYRAEKAGVTPSLAPLNSNYEGYVHWQSRMLASCTAEKLWRYWKHRLKGELPVLSLPTDRTRPAVKTYRGAQHEFRVAEETSRRLVKLARSDGATLYMLLVAAFQVFLHRYSGQEEVLIGSPTAGRSMREHKGVVGYFSNPVILRAELVGNPTFRDFLLQVRRSVLGALEHQDYPFSLLVERLEPSRDPSRSPLFDVAFAWEALRRPHLGRLTRSESSLVTAEMNKETPADLEHIFSQQRGAPFDLTLSMAAGRKEVSGAFQYNTDLFNRSTVARMARHFRNLLEAVASDPGQHVQSLRLLGEEERSQILVAWNECTAQYPISSTLPELFEAQVRKTPGSLALCQDDHRVTYAELNRWANQLAHYLRCLGVRPEICVGVFMRRSVHLVLTILGVLKAGGAYVPIDSKCPRERVATILKDAGASIVVTSTELAGAVPEGSAKSIVCLDSELEVLVSYSAENLESYTTPENLAYVIYTSGSTGLPKGVMIPHRGLVNYSCWSASAYAVDEGRGSPLLTSISFDLTITSLFPPLLAGTPVTLLPEDREMEALSNALGDHSDFSLVKLTPAHLELLVRRSCPEDLAGGARALVIGGEALSANAVSFWQEHAPATRLLNEYGPTEATVGCCVYEIPRGVQESGSIPIGRSITNAQMYVLDQALQPVPIGVVGELYIGGDGLARGYVNQADLTAEMFIPNPFSELPGTRLYRTGDLGRYLEDGNIEFVGRSDRQIKIRGFRIEPAEIELLLDQHSAVRESVITVREDRPFARRLVAYWVEAGDRRATASELRRFLEKRLPHYMVPSDFVCLDGFPLTPNGKVDRQALPPGPDPPSLEPADDFVAPRTPEESMLAEIWERVLRVKRVGIHDNFFELGGTSLDSVELASQAESVGASLQPEFLLKYQTIAELVTAPGVTFVELPRGNTVIESLGVYLPPNRVTTEEVLRRCRRSLTLPLERMTGITCRPVAGKTEFSKDLAEKAVSDCLAASAYGSKDIDLLICCNISRYDGPEFRVTFEPCTAVRLRDTFGFDNAVVLDVGNACAGMFTAIYLADVFIKAGIARRAMVVSGEYISHLTETAQREIKGDLDPRLACLTLGDAGAAVILEESSSDTVGFHDIDLYTLGRYSSYCIAKATDREHGGAIMLTDAIRSAALAVRHAVKHAAHVLARWGWSPECVHHIVMHQTSQVSLRSARQEMDRVFGCGVCHDGKVIDNLAERGNTATTTHMVAVWDAIFANRIEPGQRVVFGISGSGQTIGTALYTFDDLPVRVRKRGVGGRRLPRLQYASVPPRRSPKVHRPMVRVESLGTMPAGVAIKRDVIEMAKVAAEDCFSQSIYRPVDVDVLIYTGVYRNDFLSEPAIAAMLAGELRMNDDIENPGDGRKTLAFDVFNGAIGFLKACYVANHLIEAGKASTVMVVASEIENNRDVRPDMLLSIEETGSAMILDGKGDRNTGFGKFVFRYATRFINTFSSYTGWRAGDTHLCVESDPAREAHFLECIPDVVAESLELEKVKLHQIKVILPPQISSSFATRLGLAIGAEPNTVVDVAGGGGAYASSSLPYGWRCARSQGTVKAGDLWLLIGVGSGIEVGCVIYRF